MKFNQESYILSYKIFIPLKYFQLVSNHVSPPFYLYKKDNYGNLQPPLHSIPSKPREMDMGKDNAKHSSRIHCEGQVPYARGRLSDDSSCTKRFWKT